MTDDRSARQSFLDRVQGPFELHVFVAPLNPSSEECERFASACAEGGIKGLHLFLVFDQGPIGVLQSSVYVDGGFHDALARCHENAEHLRARGFRVIREKIEAAATNVGVPINAAEARRVPGDLCFEFHVSIAGPNDEPLVHADHTFLERLAKELTTDFGTRVPLSWNAFKAGQRFLNARTYGLGYQESMEFVNTIVGRIEKQGLVARKLIREFVVFDTNKDLDRGWLEDPLPLQTGDAP